MEIPRRILNEYTDRLNALSDASRRVADRLLNDIVYTDIQDLREKILAILVPLAQASTDTATAYASEFYNDIRETAIGGRVSPARNPYVVDATQGAVRAILARVVKGEPYDSIIPSLSERIDFDVKRAAGSAVMDMARADPRCDGWARVPSGVETCDFCLMLASRGFVYTSSKNAGIDGDGHYHPNCDCRIVPSFESMTVEGYDPDSLYDQWKDSAHAEYMRRRESPKRKRTSAYSFRGEDGLPSFNSFSDVRDYIYSADNQRDLEHRFSVLGSIFGFGSDQMRSQSIKNAVRHTQKRL